jgi:hypothetical protein
MKRINKRKHMERRAWAWLKFESDPDGCSLPLLQDLMMMRQKKAIKSSTNNLGPTILVWVTGSSQTLSTKDAMDEGRAATLHISVTKQKLKFLRRSKLTVTTNIGTLG